MKFKVIAAIAVVVVMLLATLAYLATRNSGNTEGGEQPLTEEVQ
jgi:hypothetical protein